MLPRLGEKLVSNYLESLEQDKIQRKQAMGAPLGLLPASIPSHFDIGSPDFKFNDKFLSSLEHMYLETCITLPEKLEIDEHGPIQGSIMRNGLCQLSPIGQQVTDGTVFIPGGGQPEYDFATDKIMDKIDEIILKSRLQEMLKEQQLDKAKMELMKTLQLLTVKALGGTGPKQEMLLLGVMQLIDDATGPLARKLIDKAALAKAQAKAKAPAAKTAEAAKAEQATAAAVLAKVKAGAKGMRSRLLNIVGTMQLRLRRGAYNDVVAARIEDIRNKLIGAKNSRDEATMREVAIFQTVLDSLILHVDKMEAVYFEMLPQVVKALAGIYRDSTRSELVETAAQLLDYVLAPIRFVLEHYSRAFSQMGNQKDAPARELISFVVQDALRLFQGMDVVGNCDAVCQALRSNMHVADKVLTEIVDGFSPAAYPGGNIFGPIGANLVLIPRQMLAVSMLTAVFYLHELGHLIWADLKGFAEEATQIGMLALEETFNTPDPATGKPKDTFSSETIEYNGQKLDRFAMIKQIVLRIFNEEQADIIHGIKMAGPAFVIKMIDGFAAMNNEGKNLFETACLLENRTTMEIGENGEVTVEKHLAPFVRILINIEAIRMLGHEFDAWADYCYDMLMAAVSESNDEDLIDSLIYASYVPVDSKGRRIANLPILKILNEDIVKAMVCVIRAITTTPMEALNDRTVDQVINWTMKSQKKAEAIAIKCFNADGEFEIPEGDQSITHAVAGGVLSLLYSADGRNLLDRDASRTEARALPLLRAIRAHNEARRTAA